MYFVPEGQHDISQARSAGIHEEIARPSGTVERISVLIGRQHTFQQEYLGFLKRHEHSTRCRLLRSGSGFDDEFLWDGQRLGRPSRCYGFVRLPNMRQPDI
jgi:hypothetical protein